jgi:hypothetical protein
MLQFRDFKGLRCSTPNMVGASGILSLANHQIAQMTLLRCTWGVLVMIAGVLLGVGLMRTCAGRQNGYINLHNKVTPHPRADERPRPPDMRKDS